MHGQQVANRAADSTLQPDMNALLRHKIYDARSNTLLFSDALTDVKKHHLSRASSSSSADTKPTTTARRQKVLVIFIRHFFCGICQDFLRTLAADPSFANSSLLDRNATVTVIGCGAPSLIESYRSLTGLPPTWNLYADPSTDLYRILGMRRTFSLGERNPRYLKRSLTGNMFRSIGQSVKRVPEGDVLAGGAWDVQGGEFLFERDTETAGWELDWCHRMRNSRDHTEIEDLALVLTGQYRGQRFHISQTKHISSAALVHEEKPLIQESDEGATPIKRKKSLRRALSARTHSWMNAATSLNRSLSVKVN